MMWLLMKTLLEYHTLLIKKMNTKNSNSKDDR